MRGQPWVARAAPEWVHALEGEHRLCHVRLPDDDGTCCAQRRNDLSIEGRSTTEITGW
jgi:hypothetical protein